MITLKGVKVSNHQARRAIDISVRNCDEVNRCQRKRRLRTCCLLKLFCAYSVSSSGIMQSRFVLKTTETDLLKKKKFS